MMATTAFISIFCFLCMVIIKATLLSTKHNFGKNQPHGNDKRFTLSKYRSTFMAYLRHQTKTATTLERKVQCLDTHSDTVNFFENLEASQTAEAEMPDIEENDSSEGGFGGSSEGSFEGSFEGNSDAPVLRLVKNDPDEPKSP
ncbi:MAG: hypothetical protein ACI8WB_005624 [Phenylobacterium sp.]|jgi:hypothetical protein